MAGNRHGVGASRAVTGAGSIGGVQEKGQARLAEAGRAGGGLAGAPGGVTERRRESSRASTTASDQKAGCQGRVRTKKVRVDAAAPRSGTGTVALRVPRTIFRRPPTVRVASSLPFASITVVIPELVARTKERAVATAIVLANATIQSISIESS